MHQISLTDNEMEIMELLWESKRPLSRAEIIEFTPNRSWSKSSIHILLNSLLGKEAIGVVGFVRTNKNFGRTYSPLISQEEYLISALKNSSCYKNNPSALPAVFAALLQDEEVDEEVLDELQKMIDERRKQL